MRRILLAEDDLEMRRLLTAQLVRDGLDVVALVDGTETLEVFSTLVKRWEAPDVIVMDVRMPGYSGLHVLSALRHAGWTTPVILITAFGDARVHEEAMRLGATAVHDKPFDIAELRASVANAMA